MSLQCRSGHSKPLSVKEQIGGFPQSPISTRLPKRSNALGKWLKKDLSLTAQSLRHTFSDRLRASKCPLELIDQIGGWSSIGTIGSKYGQGYELESVREQLEAIMLLDCL